MSDLAWQMAFMANATVADRAVVEVALVLPDEADKKLPHSEVMELKPHL